MQQLSAIGSPLRNLLLTIAYDGSDFHGWQIQKNAFTVQQAFQESLKRIITDEIELKGCSRTDSGVHANTYCISMKTAHTIPCQRLKAALNRFLPMSIAVLDCAEVPLDFHARYSCKSKEYVYKIWNRPERDPFLVGYAYHYRYELDEKMLNTEAKAYIGKHDFTSFCTLDSRRAGDLSRTVKNFSVTREGDMVMMKVEADGFLYNMVRIMVGTLLRIAQGKFEKGSIPGIIKGNDRKLAGPTAPACGLYLNRVEY